MSWFGTRVAIASDIDATPVCTHNNFDAIRRAAEALVVERLMIPKDIERCVADAADWRGPRQRVGMG